jgi:MSHA type pilus biogenesis protein MshL
VVDLKYSSLATGLLLSLAACSTAPVAPPSGHLQQADVTVPADTSAIPQPVQNSVALPRPKAAPKTETYSVVVQNVSAQELLFALARDAKLNVDVHPGINGTVTLNAIDQTLQQLLARISNQVDMRWALDGPNLIVMPDSPFLRTYTIDYVNMSRDTSVSTSVNSQVSTGGKSGGSGSGSSSGGNNSTTKIDNTANNHFWETLEKNLKDILHETDKILPEDSGDIYTESLDEQSPTASAAADGKNAAAAGTKAKQGSSTKVRRTTYREAASVIANPETGVITIRATSRQHEKIVEFLDRVMNSARRQVMIEATIIQVNLNDGYQQGIDWSRVRADGSGFGISLPTLSASPSSITPFTLTRTDNSNPLNLDLTIQLLKNFGTVKVLSSPKLSVLNNQTAVLKVVDNFVYFEVKSDVTSGSTGAAQKSFTTTAQTVSVGLVMSVTPQIGSDRSIILNVRPSISSISGFQTDPNPDLVSVPNRVPQIQTREIESMMRISDGEIAVLGGLMQESGNYATGKIPGVGDIPIFGELFTSRNNATTKSELVIFLRPVVIENPSVAGDYRRLKDYLPAADFNKPPAHSRFLPSVADKNTGASH